jgi:hypothetical protein
MEPFSLIFGGLLRLAPELFAIFGKKADNKHELAMFDRQLKMDALRGKQALEQTQMQGQYALSGKELDALISAVSAQAQPTGIRWVDAINSLVRPVLTFYWCIILYTVALIAQYVALTANGVSAPEAILQIWGDQERSTAAMIMGFWFVDRVKKYMR